MYEDEDKDYDIDNNVDLECNSEEMPPIVINEHLNNPLIKMDLKVRYLNC